MAYKISKRLTKKGLAFDLYYRWQGVRYRPLLGYDLSTAEAEQVAIDMIGKIHRGEHSLVVAPSVCPTLHEFLPTYWQTLQNSKAHRSPPA